MENALLADKSMEADVERMMAEHADSILRMCFVYLRDIHLAEDAMQETFIKAYRAYDGFQGRSLERTWLTRIAINVCRDFSRSSWFRIVDRRVSLDNLLEAESLPLEQDDTLITGVMHLPKKYREVILLYYYGNLTALEAADALRIAPSTVYAHIKKAQKILKTELEGWYRNE